MKSPDAKIKQSLKTNKLSFRTLIFTRLGVHDNQSCLIINHFHHLVSKLSKQCAAEKTAQDFFHPSSIIDY